VGSVLRDQRDPSGFLYRRNRYYDPLAGRFTQPDPIGLAGGINLYGFAGGDPANFSDPFGLQPPLFDLGMRLVANKERIRKQIFGLGEWASGGIVRHQLGCMNAYIRETAEASGVDPWLVKAIIYEEQTHLLPGEALFERLGYGETVGLGQVTVGYFGYTREDLLTPEVNIAAMVQLISELQAEPLLDPERPLASIATRYNCGDNCSEVSDYGRRVEEFLGMLIREGG
jgi:RHS repeat-associated protein